MALATDEAGIQFRILNGSKGPAVRATRAKTDADIQRERAEKNFERAVGAVDHRRSGSQRRANHNGFGDLGLGGPRLPRLPGVDLDAVGALRRERHRQGDELLRLGRDRPILERRLVERHERLESVGRQVAKSL